MKISAIINVYVVAVAMAISIEGMTCSNDS